MAAAVILSCAVTAEAASRARADFPNAAPEDNMSAVQFTGGAAGSTTHFPPLSTLQPASTVHSAKGTTAQGMVRAGFAWACGVDCASSTGISLMQATHPASKSAQASIALMTEVVGKDILTILCGCFLRVFSFLPPAFF